MNNSTIGGASVSPGQHGATQGSGLDNIGLLVATTGRVISVGSGYFYIDDGSALNDGLGTGIRVLATGLPLPAPNQTVRVTGISSCFKNGSTRRLLLARSQADITVIH